MNMNKKVPMRMCLGCQEMKPKKELIRIVKTKESEIAVDLSGKKPGRGAYVCKCPECLVKARKQKKLERAFGSKIEDDVFEELTKQLEAIDGE